MKILKCSSPCINRVTLSYSKLCFISTIFRETNTFGKQMKVCSVVVDRDECKMTRDISLLFYSPRCYAATGRQVISFEAAAWKVARRAGQDREHRRESGTNVNIRGGVEDSRNLKPPTSFRRRFGSRTYRFSPWENVPKGSLPFRRVTALSSPVRSSYYARDEARPKKATWKKRRNIKNLNVK